MERCDAQGAYDGSSLLNLEVLFIGVSCLDDPNPGNTCSRGNEIGRAGAYISPGASHLSIRHTCRRLSASKRGRPNMPNATPLRPGLRATNHQSPFTFHLSPPPSPWALRRYPDAGATEHPGRKRSTTMNRQPNRPKHRWDNGHRGRLG